LRSATWASARSPTEDALAFWGGEKNPECDLLAGAFNYLNLDEMLTYLAALPWEYRFPPRCG
jgi:hypothetical protein